MNLIQLHLEPLTVDSFITKIKKRQGVIAIHATESTSAVGVTMP